MPRIIGYTGDQYEEQLAWQVSMKKPISTATARLIKPISVF
jgi:hypothetical protein